MLRKNYKLTASAKVTSTTISLHEDTGYNAVEEAKATQQGQEQQQQQQEEDAEAEEEEEQSEQVYLEVISRVISYM